MVDIGIGLKLVQRRHGDTADPRHLGQVVTHQVDDHQVFGAVLGAGQEVLRQGGIPGGGRAARPRALDRPGLKRAVAVEANEALWAVGYQDAPVTQIDIGAEGSGTRGLQGGDEVARGVIVVQPSGPAARQIGLEQVAGVDLPDQGGDLVLVHRIRGFQPQRRFDQATGRRGPRLGRLPRCDQSVARRCGGSGCVAASDHGQDLVVVIESQDAGIAAHAQFRPGRATLDAKRAARQVFQAQAQLEPCHADQAAGKWRQIVILVLGDESGRRLEEACGVVRGAEVGRGIGLAQQIAEPSLGAAVRNQRPRPRPRAPGGEIWPGFNPGQYLAGDAE